MLASVTRWIWEGSFEPDLQRLEVLPPEEIGSEDLLAIGSKTLHDLEEMVSSLQAALQARRSDRPGARRGLDDGGSAEEEARKIARAMLPCLDAVDRIVEYGETMETGDAAFSNWLRSVDALRTRLLRTLEGIGLAAISSVGTEVDLEIHDVVAVVPAGEYPANVIVSEQLKGYYFRGKLLRDAKVVVAQ